MQSEIALNVQQSIRPGECVDTYYAGKENSEKQCHATVTDNRFIQGLQSRSSGSSSTVTFNPNEGLGEVLLVMTLAAPSNATGLALNKGWGYQMLRRIGYRYGSSQLYYITGQQNFVQTLALCEDSGKKDQIVYLGGQALLDPSDWADVTKRTAYIYLRLPHSSPALAGGSLPFPTDVLTAPVQLQIDLADFSSVITKVPLSAGVIPTEFSSAQVNFTQITMQDAGNLIARRFDMSKHALTIPLPEGWTQEAVQFPFTSGGDGGFSLSLTGCKAGDLKMLRIWFTDPSNVSQSPDTGLRNPNVFVPPAQIQFAINGLIYLDSIGASYLLTDLIRRRVPPTASGTYTLAPGGVLEQFAAQSTWVEVNLAQPHAIGDTGEVILVHGVPVMNSVLSLSGAMPQGSKNYICNVEYVLNCSWMASRGSAEFVF
jgi:hypothetical protein